MSEKIIRVRQNSIYLPTANINFMSIAHCKIPFRRQLYGNMVSLEAASPLCTNEKKDG